MLTAKCAALVTFLAALPWLAATPARAELAGAWAEGMNARARLIAGSAGAPGQTVAGVQIELADGWKTYWRVPGDSGIPPQFSWDGSENLADARVLYPVPHRFSDPGGQSVGYKGSVVFPVQVTPAGEGKPVTLRLSLDYAACEKLCMPEHADLELILPAGAALAPSRKLEAALAAVPVRGDSDRAPARLGEIALDRKSTPPRLTVEAVHRGEAEHVDLFVEGPKTWYMGLPEETGRGRRPDGTLAVRYTVTLHDLPKDGPTAPVSLLFTIVAGGQGAAQDWTLR